MIKASEIVVGIVAWPDTSFFSADAGCAMPYSLHNAIHPMVCVQRNETYGVWIGLSSRAKSAGGHAKMEVPARWKIGSDSWVSKPSFVSGLTTSVIVPHDLMVKATAKAEFTSTQRHRLTVDGAGQIHNAIRRAQGYTLENNPLTQAAVAPSVRGVVKKAPVAMPSRSRLSNGEYAQVLRRYGQGEGIEALAKAFNCPAERIERYLEYRKRSRSLERPAASDIDLSKASIEALREMLAHKERAATLDGYRSQITAFARQLGVEITSLELKGPDASPSGGQLSAAA